MHSKSSNINMYEWLSCQFICKKTDCRKMHELKTEKDCTCFKKISL